MQRRNIRELRVNKKGKITKKTRVKNKSKLEGQYVIIVEKGKAEKV